MKYVLPTAIGIVQNREICYQKYYYYQIYTSVCTSCMYCVQNMCEFFLEAIVNLDQ